MNMRQRRCKHYKRFQPGFFVEVPLYIFPAHLKTHPQREGWINHLLAQYLHNHREIFQ